MCSETLRTQTARHRDRFFITLTSDVSRFSSSRGDGSSFFSAPNPGPKIDLTARHCCARCDATCASSGAGFAHTATSSPAGRPGPSSFPHCAAPPAAPGGSPRNFWMLWDPLSLALSLAPPPLSPPPMGAASVTSTPIPWGDTAGATDLHGGREGGGEGFSRPTSTGGEPLDLSLPRPASGDAPAACLSAAS